MTHAVSGIAFGSAFRRSSGTARIWLAGAVCAAVPDIDVIGFRFGIDYGDLLGHRGLTHSLTFAAVLAAVVVALVSRDGTSGLSRGALWLSLFIATASHGCLDALTDGGLGVAFFSPFSNARYFFPVRPIRVSPIGLGALMSDDGLAVLASEVRWVWLPCALFVAIALAWQPAAALGKRDARGIGTRSVTAKTARTSGRSLESRFWRWLFRRAERRTIFEIPMGLLGPRSDRDLAFQKIAAAFELLRRYDSRRLGWLRDDADGILVFLAAPHRAEWNGGARLVVLEESYVRDPATSAASVASTLVHEATHARLDRMGFRYTAERRARIEAICVRRQLAFARRIPEPGDLIGEAERQLARDPAYFTDDAFRQRVAAELQKRGIPGWVVRMMERLSRRRAARAPMAEVGTPSKGGDARTAP